MNTEIELNLDDLSNKIRRDIESAGRSFLSIGESLFQAKMLCKDTDTFYNWVDSKTHIKSRRTAMAYLQVFNKFCDQEITGKVGYSILQELLTASEETIEKIENMVDDGESVTVKEVRGIVKEDSPPVITTNAELIAKRNNDSSPEPEPPWLTEERELLSLPEAQRIMEAKNCWNVLGLSQYFENCPCEETVNRIVNSLMEDYEYGDQWPVIKKAIGEINNT